jgi:hypothetical protein
MPVDFRTRPPGGPAAAFAADHPVGHLLGGHIEMTSTPASTT